MKKLFSWYYITPYSSEFRYESFKYENRDQVFDSIDRYVHLTNSNKVTKIKTEYITSDILKRG